MRWFLSLITILLFSVTAYGQSSDITTFTDIEPLQTLQADMPLDVVAFNPQSNQLATGGRDNALRLWDGDGNQTAILAGHRDWISSLAYSPDGTVLVSGGRDSDIWMWNTETSTSLRLIEDHIAEVKAVTFTPDGSYLVSGSLDGMIRFEPIGNPDGTQFFENFSGGVWSLAISPNGQALAIGSEDGTIWLIGIWDSNGTWVTPLYSHRTPVTALTWSPDGSELLSGEQNGHVILWDVSKARLKPDNISNQLYSGHLAPITAVSFSAHDEVILTTSLDGSIRLWDTVTNDTLPILHQDVTPLSHLAFNPEQNVFASVSTSGQMNLWQIDREVLANMVSNSRPAVVQNIPIPQDTNEQAETLASVTTTTQQPTPSTITLPTNTAPTLMIPSVGIQIGIKTFPLDGATWAIDPYEPLVGHLQGTSWIDGSGNIALAGHSLYPDGRAGIFNSLYNVSLGDEVIVQEIDVVRRYRVTDIRVVDYTDVSVVYPTAHNRVTLITCDIPSFQSQTGLYGERLVVIADAIN